MRRAPIALTVIALAVMLAESVSAQVFVLPRRAYKSNVRYFDFDWMHVDILVGARLRPFSGIDPASVVPAATSTIAGVGTSSTSSASSALAKKDEIALRLSAPSIAGGMRLYFYRQEHVIAERAAASIESTYKEYIRSFGFVPGERFPYVLYSSYQEFLQTNLFPVREGILGVTSTTDLKLALPFFGDYRLFREVSRHEMAHQFTIQKVREAAKEADTGNPLEQLPLWLVEGLAEFYAKRGLDPEGEMLTLDVVLNGNIKIGYGLIDFFDDRPQSGLWTYKIGQARCLFLEDTYGRGTIQRLLEASPLLASDVGSKHRVRGFPELVHAVTGDEPKLISAKFEAWIKKRTLEAYLRARQTVADVEVVEHLSEYIDTFAGSPNGELLAYRSLNIETGQAHLRIFDYRDPEADRTVGLDGIPGYESFHPFAGRNFALSDKAIAFIAEDRGADVLYVQEYSDRTTKVPMEPAKIEDPSKEPSWRLPGLEKSIEWDVDLSLGSKKKLDLRTKGIVAAYSPAFSPDGEQIAIIGLDRRGQRDLYVIDGFAGDDFQVTRLTHDEYAERAVAWGGSGIYFTSDRTQDGVHNVFRTEASSSAVVSAVFEEPREQTSPAAFADGRAYFLTMDDGRSNAYEATGGRLVQKTDFPTGVFDITPGPDGGLWALLHHGGRRQIVRIPRGRLLELDRADRLPEPPYREPELRPRLSLVNAEPYEAFHPGSWKLDNVFAVAGVGGGRVLGRVLALASDRLSNHALLLDLAALGSFDLTDGRLVYINQATRWTWGAGAFQSLLFRIDETFAGAPLQSFFSAERFFGAMALVRYPLDQFLYAQAEGYVGGVDFVLDSDTKSYLRMQPGDTPDRTALDLWQLTNSGVHFRTLGAMKLGYDTIRYHYGRGAIAGTSILLDGTIGVQPFDPEMFGTLRLDAERHFLFFDIFNFFLRGGAASTVGGKFARQFFLSSFDTIRGVPFGDQNYLLGRKYFFTTAEVQVPLNRIIALAFLTDIEGVLAVDFGGVADDFNRLLDKRVLDVVLGMNFALGPLVLRLQFAKPIDTGVPPPNEGHWVTNFSLGWLYF
jgi:hypothetical protein